MKKCLFLFLCLFALQNFQLTKSQNWGPIPFNEEINFIPDTGGLVVGFRFDSLLTIGTDSLFFSIFEFKDTTNSNDTCVLDMHVPGKLGSPAIKRNIDHWIFLTEANDSILIKPLTSISSGWEMVSDSILNLRIWATVTGISYDSVEGKGWDSIKTFQFYATDLGNNSANHVVNGKHFKIGKNYGLMSFVSFRDILTEAFQYERVFFPNLTYREIFDFEVGDTFHYETFYREHPGAQNDRYSEIISVFSKSGLPFQNSVTYTFDRKKWMQEFNYTTFQWLYTYLHDTITKTFLRNSNPIFSTLSGEFNIQPLYMYYNYKSPDAYCGRRYCKTDNYYSETYSSWDLQCFWKNNNTNEYFGTFYGVGLGIVEEYFSYSNFVNSHTWLTYFHKGNQICGTPISVGREDEIMSELKFHIFPNPSSGIISIQLKEKMPEPPDIKLFSLNGEALDFKIMGHDGLNNITQIEISNSGLYLLEIRVGSKKGIRKVYIAQ